MRRWIPLAVYLELAAIATAVAVAGGGGEPPARAAMVAASGDFSLSNSKEGLPVFGADGIAPGDSAQGTVEIANTGDVDAQLIVEREGLSDTPGLGGGLLSSRLHLRVEDVTESASPVLVYAGPLDSMPAQQAGQLEPGESRSFEFTATLSDAGMATEVDDLQGAATAVAYSWTASEAGEGEEGGEETGVPAVPAAGGSGGQQSGGGETVTRNQPFDLTVPRIRRAIRGGRLVARTDCSETCRLYVRGRVRATGVGTHRGAKIHVVKSRFYAAGARRLRIPVPRRLRRWLRETPGRERLRAKLRFVAIGTGGERDAVRKTVKLRAGRR
ncbi:MAG TPA: hypothetical protein VLL27_13000 [Solirubrobacterales bacterium]|nr:hypothetical protein [Solirubrobacterales bacterium]